MSRDAVATQTQMSISPSRQSLLAGGSLEEVQAPAPPHHPLATPARLERLQGHQLDGLLGHRRKMQLGPDDIKQDGLAVVSALTAGRDVFV